MKALKIDSCVAPSEEGFGWIKYVPYCGYLHQDPPTSVRKTGPMGGYVSAN